MKENNANDPAWAIYKRFCEENELKNNDSDSLQLFLKGQKIEKVVVELHQGEQNNQEQSPAIKSDIKKIADEVLEVLNEEKNKHQKRFDECPLFDLTNRLFEDGSVSAIRDARDKIVEIFKQGGVL